MACPPIDSEESLFVTPEEGAARELRNAQDMLLFSEGGHHDSYWRIANYTHLLDEHDELVEIARERDIKPRGLLQKDQSIVNGLNRFARGLLDYSRCSMTELEIFVQQRGITRKRWPSAAKLSAQLEAADDAHEFVRLLELSSEVRLGIYKYYCSHFSHMGLCQPTPPPRADTCRQLRQEVLPVFYSQCIFQIHLTYPLPKCRLTSKTASYFMALNPAYLARIRKWQVCVYHEADSIDENTGPPEPCVDG
ncbi:hypothetical protein LTR95_017267 [Oleoguttula sp. CCFEE 5521]